MAISLYTVTGNAADVLGVNFDSKRVKVVVSTNLPRGEAPIDLEGNRVLLGGGIVWPDAEGAFTIPDLVGFDSEDVNPTGIQYKIDLVYVDKSSKQQDLWSTGWVSITEDTTVDALVAEQYAPPSWQTAFMTDAEQVRDETRGYRDEAAEIAIGDVPNASTTARGALELATNTEAAAGSDAVRGITPAGLRYALGNGQVAADLSATYAQFTDVNGDPLPPGHIVQIRLSADLSEIDDIVVVEA